MHRKVGGGGGVGFEGGPIITLAYKAQLIQSNTAECDIKMHFS
jgi:hypothetical protein